MVKPVREPNTSATRRPHSPTSSSIPTTNEIYSRPISCCHSTGQPTTWASRSSTTSARAGTTKRRPSSTRTNWRRACPGRGSDRTPTDGGRASAGDRRMGPQRRVKKFREATRRPRFRHHTMLVHESVQTADHADTADDVRRLWNRSEFTSAGACAAEAVRAGLSARDAARAKERRRPELRRAQAVHRRAIAEMEAGGDPVLIVNSDKAMQDQQKNLDFEEKVWRILVGGAQLSRGFTVEGLTVSYFRRRAGQADTLMRLGAGSASVGATGTWCGCTSAVTARSISTRRSRPCLMDEEAFRGARQVRGLRRGRSAAVSHDRSHPWSVSTFPGCTRPPATRCGTRVIDSKATAGDFQGATPASQLAGDAANASNLINVGLPLLKTATQVALVALREPIPATGTETFKVGVVEADEFLKLFRQAWLAPGVLGRDQSPEVIS